MNDPYHIVKEEHDFGMPSCASTEMVSFYEQNLSSKMLFIIHFKMPVRKKCINSNLMKKNFVKGSKMQIVFLTSSILCGVEYFPN